MMIFSQTKPTLLARALPAVVLLLMVLLAYLPVTLRAGFIWDDDDYVTQNKNLRDFAGLRRIWLEPRATPQYYPLVHTTFWLEYHLWGLHPAGYHLVNVGLHAANAVLLWLALRWLQVPGAWLAAAIFALHPVHVESVAWITERKNVLSGLFYLAALLAFLRFAGCTSSTAKSSREATGVGKFYWLSLILFLAALLSKTVTASLPAALLLLLWWKRERLSWKDVVPLAPLFVVGAAMGLLTAWLEKHHVGASGADFDFTLAERCLIAGRAVWFYAGKLLWPLDLAFIYPRWTIDAPQAWQWLFPLSAVCVPLGLYLARHKLGKGPLVAVLYFGGTLLPALGFINVFPMVYSFVADHFQYLASIGLIALAAAALNVFYRRARAGLTSVPVPIVHGAGRALCAGLLIALAVRTWQQGRTYENSEILWRATLAHNSEGWMPNLSYGISLHARGAFEKALFQYQKALQADSSNPLIHLSLAKTLAAQNKYRDATFHNHVAVESGRHDLASQGHLQLAEIFEATHDLDRASEHLRHAIRLDPSWSLAQFKLGLVLAKQGKPREALVAFYAALKLEPDSADVHKVLGAALQQQGDLAGAAEHYRQAAQIRPEDTFAHNALGAVLVARGQLGEAEDAFRRAVASDPGNASAMTNLAVLTAARGNDSEALRLFQQAILAEPENPQHRAKQAITLLRAGRADLATVHLRDALRLAEQAGDEPTAAAIQKQLAAISSQSPKD